MFITVTICDSMKEPNYKKFMYLSILKMHPNLSCRDLAEKTFSYTVDTINSEITFDRHFLNTAQCLNRYATSYKHSILKRRKMKGVFVYSLSKHGKTRLKQMIVAKAFFGSYRLKLEGVQLLEKDRFGNFGVNSDVIKDAAAFFDIDEVHLWQFVPGYIV